MPISPTTNKVWCSDLNGLQRLVDEALSEGFNLLGPTPLNGAVTFGPIRQVSDLPVGFVDEQSPGNWRLTQSGTGSVFGVLHSSCSAKPFLFPPRSTLWRAKKMGATVQLMPVDAPAPKTALIGLRPCDIHAVLVQDKVLAESPIPDPDYQRRREATLLIVVNCTRANPTCFCKSMGGGTRCWEGHDIAITELADQPSRFLYEAGSDKGRDLLKKCRFDLAHEGDVREAERRMKAAEAMMEKGIDVSDIKDLLYRNAEHPVWQQVGERCFACTSCTQVCPTCFCHTPVDSSTLDTVESTRERVWDSCFGEDFSYIHGGSIRRSISSRYRQWMTHKLAAWQDQFDMLGCVGCGRCITWCPAGIDLRDEAEEIRQHDLVKTSKRKNSVDAKNPSSVF